MTKTCRAHLVLICLSLSLLLVWGCASSPPSRFYTLTALSGAADQDTGRPISAGASIGLGPIRFPDYLDRPGIVTRPGGGSAIEIADFDLWAGSFKEGVMNTLAQNLSVLLNTNKILVYPFLGVVKLDYRILLMVERFEGALGGEVTLVTRWVLYESLSEEPEKKEGRTQRARIVEPVQGSDYAAMVAAQSRAVERLSREIAQAIQSLPAPAAAK
jgi:uncharacterized lipoprotein YmbA